MKRGLFLLVIIILIISGGMCYASSITIDNGIVSVNGATESSKLIIAFYNELRALISVKTYNGSDNLTIPYVTEKGASEIKAFLWNMETLSPLCDAKSKKLTDYQDAKKILIAYFSQERVITPDMDSFSAATPHIGNTATAAREIRKQIDGDIFEIVTVKTYPADDNSSSGIAQQELRDNVRPELSTHVEDMDSYDTIFLGYPMWWGYEPMAVRTFLEEYDFSGKTIIPFCTSGESTVSASARSIQELCPGAAVLEGLTLHEGRDDFDKSISEWLDKLNLTE